MKRFSILLFSVAFCALVAAGSYDSSVTKKASTEQVSVSKVENSVFKACSFEYEVPVALIYDRVALVTPKPQPLPYAEKLARGFVAVNKGPPDYRCQKS